MLSIRMLQDIHGKIASCSDGCYSRIHQCIDQSRKQLQCLRIIRSQRPLIISRHDNNRWRLRLRRLLCITGDLCTSKSWNRINLLTQIVVLLWNRWNWIHWNLRWNFWLSLLDRLRIHNMDRIVSKRRPELFYILEQVL